MPSFDVVSKVQMHEVDNALLQAQKEVITRYDFRDTGASIERTDEGIVLRANSEGRVEAALSVLQEKFVRRKLSVRSLEVQKTEKASGGTFRQLLKLNQGIDKDKARDVVKYLKDQKLKVQSAVQGDAVRVSGKQRDDLQDCMKALRAHDFGIDLQFENFRE